MPNKAGSARADIIAQGISRFRHADPNEVIIHQDDADDQVYIILSGRVKVTNFSKKGREIWHSELLAGTFFGEMAALTGAPRSVSITAVEPTKLAILSRNEFFDVIRHDPEIAIWILEEMARRLEERTDKMNAVISQSISQRIRAEILRLAQQGATDKGDHLIAPVPNFTEMAKRLNTDRENVSREFSALSRQGVLKKEKVQVRVLKPEVLAQNVDV